MYQKCKSMVVISIYSLKFLKVQGNEFPVINEDIKRFICKPWNLHGWKLRKRCPPLLLPPPLLLNHLLLFPPPPSHFYYSPPFFIENLLTIYNLIISSSSFLFYFRIKISSLKIIDNFGQKYSPPPGDMVILSITSSSSKLFICLKNTRFKHMLFNYFYLLFAEIYQMNYKISTTVENFIKNE